MQQRDMRDHQRDERRTIFCQLEFVTTAGSNPGVPIATEVVLARIPARKYGVFKDGFDAAFPLGLDTIISPMVRACMCLMVAEAGHSCVKREVRWCARVKDGEHTARGPPRFYGYRDLWPRPGAVHRTANERCSIEAARSLKILLTSVLMRTCVHVHAGVGAIHWGDQRGMRKGGRPCPC